MAFKPITVSSVKKYESEQFAFDTTGETLEGHLVDSVTLTKDGKSFQKYTVWIADGSYVSTLGSYQLDQALSQVTLGAMIRITYKGKTKLSGGKSVKNFLVESDESDNVLAGSSTASNGMAPTAAPKTAKDTIAAMRAS